MKRINESLIYQEKLNILKISADYFYGRYLLRVLPSCSPRTAKWCVILKSPVILLKSIANLKGQGNLTEHAGIPLFSRGVNADN